MWYHKGFGVVQPQSVRFLGGCTDQVAVAVVAVELQSSRNIAFWD